MVAAVAVQVQQAGVEAGARHPLQGLLPGAQKPDAQAAPATGASLLEHSLLPVYMLSMPARLCTGTCMPLADMSACMPALLQLQMTLRRAPFLAAESPAIAGCPPLHAASQLTISHLDFPGRRRPGAGGEAQRRVGVRQRGVVRHVRYEPAPPHLGHQSLAVKFHSDE